MMMMMKFMMFCSGTDSYRLHAAIISTCYRNHLLELRPYTQASCTIEASARIYACRVDCVHTDTYRVLGGLNSADIVAWLQLGEALSVPVCGPKHFPESASSAEMSEANEDGQPGEDGKPSKKRRICGVNTLEPCTKDSLALRPWRSNPLTARC